MLATILYNIGINLADQLQSVGKYFNEKAKKRVDGLSLQSKSAPYSGDSKRILIHCASYGEFEQIKPLIEMIRASHNDVYIIVSFFSPSGYEMASNYVPVNQIVYFPMDTKGHMRTFISNLKPDLVLLVKYEIWVNFINNLYGNNIPIYLISGLFLPQYIYFKWYGSIFSNALKKLTGILVQDNASKEHLLTLGIESDVCGDSRTDRVYERSQSVNHDIEQLIKWKGEKPILILGSIWPEDWAKFKPVIAEILIHYNLIIAPHEISELFNKRIFSEAGKGILWSEHLNGLPKYTELVLVDKIGLLADIYRHGDVAYIGGAFKQGLHNIFEPAVYGLPIIFGPELGRFPEATMLIENHAASSIKNSEELRNNLLKLASNKELRLQQGKIAKDLVLTLAGSSTCIYSHIKQHLD